MNQVSVKLKFSNFSPKFEIEIVDKISKDLAQNGK